MSLFDLNDAYDVDVDQFVIEDDGFLGGDEFGQVDTYVDVDDDGRFAEPNQILPRRDEHALFGVYPMQLPGFNGCAYMAISDDTIVYAHPNKPLITYVRLSNVDMPKDVVVTKSQDTVERLFVDPSACHCLVSMTSGELYYVNWKAKKPVAKSVSPKQKMPVYAVAWSVEQPTSSVTGEILLGTDGHVYETVINDHHKVSYLKSVFTVEGNAPVTGLHLERYPEGHMDDDEVVDERVLVMAATPTRLYDFVGVPDARGGHGGAVYASVFSSATQSFQDMPSADKPHSVLRTFSKWGSVSESFCWTNAFGVFHGSLTFDESDRAVTDTDMVPFPKVNKVETPASDILLTQFHFFMLYDERIVAVCHLNKKVVHSVPLPRQMAGWRKGLALDPVTKMLWMYSDTGIFEVVVSEEDRDMWQLFLENEEFEKAYRQCTEKWQREKVLVAKAEWHFGREEYTDAARTYSKCEEVTFESVVLKFVEAGEYASLKLYLDAKLAGLEEEHLTQKLALCTWLCEYFLNALNVAAFANEEGRESAAYTSLQEAFRAFLEKHHKSLDPRTTVHLFKSFGATEELLNYNMLVENYGQVMAHHIQAGDHLAALRVLRRQVRKEVEAGLRPPDLFYRFAAVFVSTVPFQTVELWKRCTFLDARKLLPALMKYDVGANPDGVEENMAIEYLQDVVRRNEDPLVHNFLIMLYAQQKDDLMLLNFIDTEAHDQCFDPQFALRVCYENNKLEACVYIYRRMQLYEEAVDLALTVGLELAKMCAEYPPFEDDQKKLWLKIARHVIEEQGDIAGAIEIVSQKSFLDIEDILPFFPDTVLIDDFQEQICESLNSYNSNIDVLKQDMKESTASSEEIRKDIKRLRLKSGTVVENQRCELCGQAVLTRKFYLFPCQHVFHTDCMSREMVKHMSRHQRGRLDGMLRQCAQQEETLGLLAKNSEGARMAQREKDRLQGEIDEIVASSCLYCGEVMLSSIDEPFIGLDEYEEEAKWTVDWRDFRFESNALWGETTAYE